MIQEQQMVNVNGVEVPIEGERNLLELIRKAGIELPTFCYHSDLSIYGACRLCLVDVDGKGIMASCSTAPAPGMSLKTNTEELRAMRKMTLELLLANHHRECPTCSRSNQCSLQDLARQLGVENVRFKSREADSPIDTSSPSIVRDPNKCVLCGDCVRVCEEVQGIGAIDFCHRGAKSTVAPAFERTMGEVECVNCGQCAAVCPTGALIPKQDRENVWTALHDPEVTVVAQIAPAVRVALGEYFGMPAGENVTGKLVTALKMMGFDHVYDTCFTADMTILEEATELLGRVESGRLPLFTSCCPGWVKFAETYFPDLLDNVSTCKSPQQMFGAVARKALPGELGVEPSKLKIVSIMPCTAKKFEAGLEKFKQEGVPDVDFVLTTQEVGRMIHASGLNFEALHPGSLDMPMGFYTGAGVIFGATGGVMEAALRYAVEKIQGKRLASVDFTDVRGEDGIREATYDVNGMEVKVAVVHGLSNARKVAEQVRKGESPYHFIEVMACPGGCIGGAGQPISKSRLAKQERTRGLYDTDKNLQLHTSQENYFVDQCYDCHLGGEVGGHEAHHCLHTKYENRSDVFDIEK